MTRLKTPRKCSRCKEPIERANERRYFERRLVCPACSAEFYGASSDPHRVLHTIPASEDPLKPFRVPSARTLRRFGSLADSRARRAAIARSISEAKPSARAVAWAAYVKAKDERREATK